MRGVFLNNEILLALFLIICYISFVERNHYEKIDESKKQARYL